MAGMKTVEVTTTMGGGTRIDSNIRGHEVCIDQPPAAGGNDAGPTPLEYLLFSLAGCIASIARIMANQQRLAIRSMEVTVSGDLNLEVLLGKDQNARAGFQEVNIQVSLDSDMSRDEQEAFIQAVERRCPVSENLANSTPITIALAD